jgi:glycosyltransferase involved in cell wall biosynthesis
MIFRSKKDSVHKRVAIYSEAFLPNIGGGENYCVDLARTLTDLGEAVTVITPIQSLTEDKFNFNLIRMRKPFFIGFNVNFLEPFFHIVKERPKVVILSGPAISDFAMIPLLHFFRIPIVQIFHGQFNKKWARALMKIVAPTVYMFVDKIIVQSIRDLKYLKDMNIPVSKIVFFIFNGVDREKFKCPPKTESYNQLKVDKPLKFIFIGGLTSSRPYKGIDLLLEIFKNIGGSDIYPTPELVVVGGGDLLEPLREGTKNFKNIHFLGYIDDDELMRELCESDMLILPSKTDGEGIGKVIFEAMSCGKPVMVSKFAGASEMVGRYEAGIIFDPFGIDDTINIIRLLNSQREILKNFSSNGQKMMAEEGLDLLNTTKRHMRVYEEVIGSIKKN